MRKVRAINRIKPIVNGIMGSEEKGASCYEPNKEPRVRRGMKGNVIAIVHSVINFELKDTIKLSIKSIDCEREDRKNRKRVCSINGELFGQARAVYALKLCHALKRTVERIRGEGTKIYTCGVVRRNAHDHNVASDGVGACVCVQGLAAFHEYTKARDFLAVLKPYVEIVYPWLMGGVGEDGFHERYRDAWLAILDMGVMQRGCSDLADRDWLAVVDHGVVKDRGRSGGDEV
ncbi:hypothetical protein B0H13DRAFT_1923011 [Mycena leptocephala]|nr:hypothetical protein B0H13DRAFT_1923011 [Mycena leptocephala]